MARTLVTYFSRTGRTRRIALEIAEALRADIERIEEPRSRLGLLGYWRSGREAYLKLAPNIEPAVHDPSSYGLVVLGTPIWAGNMSSPIRAYVNAHRGSFERAAFFCTHGGTTAQKVFDEIAEICGVRPLATLAVTEREIKTGTYADKLRQFLERLSAAALA
jgi:flavodoxin